MGGIPVRDLRDLVKPLREAKHVVFYSLAAEGPDGGTYYDVHSIEGMRHELSLLAYDMNGEQLSVLHGAPLRLRATTSRSSHVVHVGGFLEGPAGAHRG